MAEQIYWLEVEADRNGVDVLVNDVPAEHLIRTHGARFPINEYLVRGGNRVSVLAGNWGSNKGPGEGGQVKLEVIRLDGSGPQVIGRQTLVSNTVQFQQAPPGAVLGTIDFVADNGIGIDTLGLELFGPQQEAAVLDRLAAVAELWQVGDAQGIQQFMRRYVQDYVKAYPLETVGGMEERIGRMAGDFRQGKVEFDRSATRLVPLAGGKLVDCQGPRGAALRIALPGNNGYDMWAVMGVERGQAVLVR